MRQTLFRGAALACSVGVAVVVATGGQGCGPTSATTATTATTAAAASVVVSATSAGSGAAPVASAPPADTLGVIGPSTKADPHAIRRAVDGLMSAKPTAPPPPSAAPR
jgi:hypothetical protein